MKKSVKITAQVGTKAMASENSRAMAEQAEEEQKDLSVEQKASRLDEFVEHPQCPKCLCKITKTRRVTITGPPEYLRWECTNCGYYSHMEPADSKRKKVVGETSLKTRADVISYVKGTITHALIWANAGRNQIEIYRKHTSKRELQKNPALRTCLDFAELNGKTVMNLLFQLEDKLGKIS